jgi:hypothetical protein
MACDLCNCADHPLRPCPTCLNCVGHYEETADPTQDHTDYTATSTEYTQNSTTVDQKPHYVYDARTGVMRPKNQPA